MKKPLPTARGVCRLIGHHYVLVGTQVFVVLFCLVGFFLKQTDILTNIQQGLHALLCLKFTFVITVFVAHAQMQIHKAPCDLVSKVYCHLHAKSCPS